MLSRRAAPFADSWFRVFGLFAGLLLTIVAFAALVTGCTLFGDDPDVAAARRAAETRARARQDRADVIKHNREADAEVRRRGSLRPSKDEPQEQPRPRRESSYQGLLPGYEGIDIVDSQ